MAYAYNEYTGTTDTDYLISFSGATGVSGEPGEFGYLDQDHVIFYLNGTAQDNSLRTFIDDTHVRIAAPLTTDTVRFQRESSIETPMVDWSSGAGVSASNLDTNTLQMLYIAMENADKNGEGQAEAAAASAASAKSSEISASESASYVSSQIPDWELVNDTTPQLGGDLDMNSNTIAGITSTEIGRLSGITTNIETGKQDTVTGAATTVLDTDLTVSRALVSDATGKIAVASLSKTELDYVEGVTSSVQDQLDSKVNTSSGSIVRGWVNFNGTTVDGTNDMTGVADSYNVSGVVDNGTGDYTIYWDTDFSNASYTIAGAVGNGGVADSVAVTITAIDVGYIQIKILNGNGIVQDKTTVCVIAIGDQ